MIGFLMRWTTIPTLILFPILVLLSVRLAVAEEREVAHRFGPAWQHYAARTPSFIPRPGRRPPGPEPPSSPTEHSLLERDAP